MSEQKNTPQKHIILVVEDDDAIAEVIALVLEDTFGCQVHHVATGDEALQMATTLSPRLLLLDYQLPHMTGIQVYDEAQHNQNFKHVPTILMSANLPWEELKKRKLVGIQKPFEIDELIDLVKRVCGPTLESEPE